METQETHAFVAADLTGLSWGGQLLPTIRHDAHVRVADSRMGQIDQDFSRSYEVQSFRQSTVCKSYP